MCKKSWFFGLGQEVGCLHGGKTIYNTWKRGWNRKEGRENKDFKKGELGHEVGALKKEELEPPYELRTIAI